MSLLLLTSVVIGAESVKRVQLIPEFQSSAERHFVELSERLEKSAVFDCREIWESDLYFISFFEGRNLLYSLLANANYVTTNKEVMEGERVPDIISATSAHDAYRFFVSSFLIQRGIDINWQDDDGNTVLMASVLRNDQEAVKFLLSMDANRLLKNNLGDTVYDLAQEKGNIEVLRILSAE